MRQNVGLHSVDAIDLHAGKFALLGVVDAIMGRCYTRGWLLRPGEGDHDGARAVVAGDTEGVISKNGRNRR